jgi:hypothetical protein
MPEKLKKKSVSKIWFWSFFLLLRNSYLVFASVYFIVIVLVHCTISGFNFGKFYLLKRVRGVAPVVACMSSKCEALSSNPSKTRERERCTSL